MSDVVIKEFDTEDIDDIAKRLERWSKNLKRYLAIKKVTDNSMKISHLFLYGGNGLEDVYESIAEEGEEFDDIIKKLDAHFKPTSNTNLHIHQFREMTQFDEETFDTFV